MYLNPLWLFVVVGANASMPWDKADMTAFKRSSMPPKIRGVNLGGWMISEPWMMIDEWRKMGSEDACSEFDCVMSLGQATADKNFDAHQATWITTDDIQRIHDVGLNTIRIPVGYWTYRDIVDEESEHFPNMNLAHLDNIIEKAASLGMFVIMDLHGAPYAQTVNQPFTGQCISAADLPAFFQKSQYDRAARWLSWMTERIHSTPSYKATVGIIQVLNEPQTEWDEGKMPQEEKDTLTQVYYPQALEAVRSAEAFMSVPDDDNLHVQFMDSLWSTGNPRSQLPSSDESLVFDDHNYIGWAVRQRESATQADYMAHTCGDDRLRDGDTPKVVEQFSLMVLPDIEWSDAFDPTLDENLAFYRVWWGAQSGCTRRRMAGFSGRGRRRWGIRGGIIGWRLRGG